MEAFMRAYLATGAFMGSVLVARGDTVVHAGGYGMANLEHQAPNTAQTVFRLGSLTKQFTAAAILQLQEQGRLRLTDTVDRHLPDYPHGGEITIHQLLNHTSGVPDYAGFEGHSTEFRNPITLDGLMDGFSRLPLDFAPGSRYQYSNSGYVVLTAIIESVSRQPYAVYLLEHIFRPLHMDSTGYEDSSAIVPDRAAGYTWDGAAYHNAEFIDMSNPAGAGGLITTVSDIYRWDRALYAGAVLNAAARQAYFTPSADMGRGISYAYGWAVAEKGGRRFDLHSGGINGFSSFVLRYPAEQLYVVVLSNVESAPTQAVAEGLMAIALGDPYELPGQYHAANVDPAIYEKYVGRYEIARGVVTDVTTEAGRLYVQATNEPRVEVKPESTTQFYVQVNGMDIRLRFEVGPDGAATGLVIIQGGQELTATKLK
jgi:CubicO group peptidase (beta-lactamase class C family)